MLLGATSQLIYSKINNLPAYRTPHAQSAGYGMRSVICFSGLRHRNVPTISPGGYGSLIWDTLPSTTSSMSASCFGLIGNLTPVPLAASPSSWTCIDGPEGWHRQRSARGSLATRRSTLATSEAETFWNAQTSHRPSLLTPTTNRDNVPALAHLRVASDGRPREKKSVLGQREYARTRST